VLGIVAFVLIISGVYVGAAQAAPQTISNSLGMQFVLIPSGEFMMGSDEPVEVLAKDFPLLEQKRFAELVDETPVHKVQISKPFYLGQHEVTIEQFMFFLKASGYIPEAEDDGTGGYGYNSKYDAEKSARGDAFEGRNRRYSWAYTGFEQGNDHPVVNVTWNDAQALARWLSEKEGVRYRLPTEAEWEYAARAGTRTRYHSGNEAQSLLKVANLFDADAAKYWPKWRSHALAGHDGYAFTAPVASFAPNAFGLYDMHGNVWEWCADWYDENYYAKSPLSDPPGPVSGNVRVRRGGSWHTWPFYVRSSYRNWNSAETRYTLVGIRLVLEVASK
jgi:formylglycine-generating enzyme